jgi:hypothetical protein
MLLQDKLIIATTLGILLVLGGTAWLLFGSKAGENEKQKRLTHMHCSVCGEEIAYNPRAVDEPCAACGSGAYVPTSGSFQGKEEKLSQTGKVFVYLLLAVVLLQGLAYVSVSRLRRMRQAVEEFHQRLVVCLCPFCQRKIGYPASKAGTGIFCSRCKTAFALPPADLSG